MSKQRNALDTETLRIRLVELLKNFEDELKSPNLRDKVLALVPAHRLLCNLGVSLIPKKLAGAARDRIIYYFQKYPGRPVSGSELMVVAGISEWARRIRELRTQFGWSIVNGGTAKEIIEAGDSADLNAGEIGAMGPNDYILLDTEQDRDAAHRWHSANDLRKGGGGVRDKILEYLRKNIGIPVTGEELRYVSNDKSEWARRVRELRTEFGWPILTKSSGRPDLSVGVYILAADRQSAVHDRRIPDAVRSAVLLRDGYKCTTCGWSQAEWSSTDPRHFEPHHIKHHAKGGENTVENLTTLCSICHDTRHATERNVD